MGTVRDANDAETFRGGMTTPFNLGSQQYQAESSAHQFALRDALRIESYQAQVEEAIGAKLTLGLQSQGVREPAVLRLKRNNAEILRTTAEVYNVMLSGVSTLVSVGVPVDLALTLIETLSGIPLPSEIIEGVKESVAVDAVVEEPVEDEPSGWRTRIDSLSIVSSQGTR